MSQLARVLLGSPLCAAKQRLEGLGPHPSLLSRLIKFNIVGAVGIVVQSSVLALLVRMLGLEYLAATALAVEAAIIHNFIWHLRWTWAERVGQPHIRSWLKAIGLLMRFNLTTGAVSIAGNLLFMRLLVGETGIGIIKANLATIALCSLANFILSDRVVFKLRAGRQG
jgi:putative flippase GtrA